MKQIALDNQSHMIRRLRAKLATERRESAALKEGLETMLVEAKNEHKTNQIALEASHKTVVGLTEIGLDELNVHTLDWARPRLIKGIVIPVVDRIGGSTASYSLKCRFPRETGRSQAPRRQQVSRGNRHFTVDCGRLRQSGPRPEMGFLRQPALEGLTRSARTDSPRQDWPETIFGEAAAAAAA
ncbi:myosin-14 [Dorcoceras hygrometricum]|uniref:Myosin-14 n=1 Tax=Dorcoceras hygrometricum TaxID=472368 RepID=A0A2Z7D679_9LAMI|nr:myosin-14 [Dorcoceras hygrometricum]